MLNFLSGENEKKCVFFFGKYLVLSKEIKINSHLNLKKNMLSDRLFGIRVS